MKARQRDKPEVLPLSLAAVTPTVIDEEASASVRLDTEGDVHSCYEGHDCAAR